MSEHRVQGDALTISPYTDLQAPASRRPGPPYAADHVLQQRYRVHALLGQGNGSYVHRATDTWVDRDVALKALPLHGRSPIRVQREARILGRIAHPRIVRLYDLFREDDTFVLVLELVAGGSLERRLRDGPLPIRKAISYAVDLLVALDHIHANSVVHRDVKPSNLLVTEDDHLVLADFGIGKGISPTGDDEDGVTIPGALVGTPAYMAPEQIIHQPAVPATDVFAAGTVIYRMLTGYLPHQAATMKEVIQNIVYHPPVDILHYRPHCPLPVYELVRAMLSKTPADRPSPNVVAAAFKRLLVSGIDVGDGGNGKVVPTPSPPPTINLDADSLIRTHIPEIQAATNVVPRPLDHHQVHDVLVADRLRGFYGEELRRLQADARTAAVVSVILLVAVFLVLVCGIVLLFLGRLGHGALTLAADILPGFLVKVAWEREAKLREEVKVARQRVETAMLAPPEPVPSAVLLEREEMILTPRTPPAILRPDRTLQMVDVVPSNGPAGRGAAGP